MMFMLLWLTGVILCWLPFSIALVRSLNEGTGWSSIPEPEDYIFGTIFGLGAAALWPIALPVYGISRLVRRAIEGEVSHYDR